MDHETILSLDPAIHTPARLAILSILATVEQASFSYLKKAVGVTDGNLSTHLSKLEKTEYIHIHKSFKGKKPQTTCSISPKGHQAFLDYMAQLEQIVQSQKGKER